MPTYKEVQSQIEKLEKQAKTLKADAVAKVQQLMVEFGLSISDIGKKITAAGKKRSSAKRPVSLPKYQDPKTGATWSGVGKPPKWIAAAIKAGKKDDFLIKPVTAQSPAVKSTVPAKKVGAKPKAVVASKKAAIKPKVAAPKASAKKPAAKAKAKPSPKPAAKPAA